MTHFSHECCKKLKEFMGDKSPKPLDFDIRFTDCFSPPKDWSYQLHDVLSKPFCEAFANTLKPIVVNTIDGYGLAKIHYVKYEPVEILSFLGNKYFNGGLEAVEKELIKMMGGAK